MRITKIHLQNIGVFEDTTIEFPEKTDPDKAEIHILTGENGTGKSTLLYVLASIFGVYPNLISRFRFRNPTSLFSVFLDDKSDFGYFFTQEGLLSKYPPISFPHSYTEKVSSLENTPLDYAFFAYSGYRSMNSTQIKAIQELTSSPLHHALKFDNSIDSALFTQWVANNKTKEALELIKNGQGKAERYRKSISRIEEVVAEIIDKKIEFVLETEPLTLLVSVEGKQLSFDALPDGLKSIISWMGDLLMRLDRIKWTTNVEVLDRNFIIFLDEIDVHLHPAWQRKILPVVQKLFKNAQIFVSTHSPFVVGSVDGAWVHKLVLDEKGNSHTEPPRKSEDGHSYQLILKEVFDIDERFGVGTEEMLSQFQRVKSDILHNRNYDKDKFLKLAYKIAVQSIELQSIIGMELRQLSRIKQTDFSI
jgi:predicted ATP-binding protein involved in virulence